MALVGGISLGNSLRSVAFAQHIGCITQNTFEFLRAYRYSHRYSYCCHDTDYCRTAISASRHCNRIAGNAYSCYLFCVLHNTNASGVTNVSSAWIRKVLQSTGPLRRPSPELGC